MTTTLLMPGPSAGILIRQAYTLALDRDPSKLNPPIDDFEKQQRRKVWQAVFMQDTFLTIILKRPPTAYQYDVRIEGLGQGAKYDSQVWRYGYLLHPQHVDPCQPSPDHNMPKALPRHPYLHIELRT